MSALDSIIENKLNKRTAREVNLANKAAAELAALRAENARLRAIAEAAEEMAEVLTDIPDDERVGDILSSYRRAKEAE